MATTVTVTIDEQGDPTIEVKGVAGASCKDLTKELEQKLGAVTDTQPTREAELRSTSTNQVKQN